MLRPPLLALAVLSAAALGYEVLLMRLLSIIQWHHFAYMMISVALLGYGAAGAGVAMMRHAFAALFLRHFVQVFAGGAVLFGICAIACFALAQRVAFNPLEILWDPGQPLRLVAVYLLLFVPFFFAAVSVCLTFTCFNEQIHRVYSFDILGAGLGCLAIIAVLFVLDPANALRLVGGAGMAAAALAAFECRWHRPWLPVALLGAALLPAALPDAWIALRPSEYKELSQILRIGNARVVDQRSSPLGTVTVVESPSIPLRHAPGLSLNATMEPPPQLAIFTDGDGLSALNHYDGRREPLAYLGDLTSALPFHLLDRPKVLVLGSGAGADVLQAIYHHASSVDAVELNPQVIDLVQRRFAAFSGKPYSAPGVHVFAAEARGFLVAGNAQYDLIQVALLDSFSTSSAGLYALSESYLYTVEAFQEYLRHLRPGGLLAITRWVTLPPRDIPKLLATAVTAMEDAGVPQPARRLALIRGWKTATLLVKNGDFVASDIAALRAFCTARSFDTEYYPGIQAAQANRFNVLETPEFFESVQALLGADRDGFIARYKFDVRPATDDRPYFFHFFKWRSLPELLSLKAQGGLPLLEWGYPVLVATLLQATCAALLLILIPLWAMRRWPAARRAPPQASTTHAIDDAAIPPSSWRIGVYFLAVGFAFMFVEIAFIQKLILFLSHPLYAIAVVLSAFLVFAGLGSRYSRRMTARYHDDRKRPVEVAVAGICLVSLFYLATLPHLFRLLIALPDAGRIAVSIMLIAPLAFLMGMPFPLGLANVARHDEALVPWAWGINACASVVASVLATLMAIHFGFTAVVLAALLLYIAAATAST
ncbi:Spermidine synthase [Cupriavidus sp. YR651]|uniref:spermine/spermidine synthase domain-containing protein n=1 Tax=Cupriavidus sp. YR651 TaxID=1855315 RepID=UPI00088CFF8C|nr:SAM-dependent methyltransferase [Cupriavidus sp. YR651]SDD73519.1 Spermidine synthase [Cupriavidus sp. YR651]